MPDALLPDSINLRVRAGPVRYRLPPSHGEGHGAIHRSVPKDPSSDGRRADEERIDKESAAAAICLLRDGSSRKSESATRTPPGGDRQGEHAPRGSMPC